MSRQEWIEQARKKAPQLSPAEKAAIAAALQPVAAK